MPCLTAAGVLGIARTIASLSAVAYPAGLFAVWVVADNCTDDTASLARAAGAHVLGKKLPLNKMRGTFHDFKGIPVIATFHPAALLRNPEWKKDVWEDMKTLLRKMGRPVPGVK